MVEMAVMEQLRNVFSQADADDNFSDHVIGMEIDHLSALTRQVIRAYLTVWTMTYAKKNTQIIVHGNIQSSRHEMTQLILFRDFIVGSSVLLLFSLFSHPLCMVCILICEIVINYIGLGVLANVFGGRTSVS